MKRSATAALLALIVACITPNGTQGPDPSTPSDSTTATSTSPAESVPTSPGDLTCWDSPAVGGEGPVAFEDVTEQHGLVDPLLGMHGHAAAFGLANDDQDPDLVVGGFGDREPEAYQVRGADGPTPDQLLLSPGPAPVEGWSEELARTSGAVFADFDLDGDRDLLLVRHAGRDGDYPVPTRLYENEGGELVAHSEPLPADFRGRTPAVADFDGDGMLDVYVSEDNSGETGGLLLRNLGNLDFEDVTAGSGLEGAFALSATAGAIDAVRLPDLATSTQVFINRGEMHFDDATPTDYLPEPIGEEDDPAGVALGDLNRDGWTDLVVGQHYRATVEFDSEVPVRVFLGTGDESTSILDEVTTDIGMTPLPTLAPHVDIADMDNDGWPDIVTTASASDGGAPAVYRNTGEDPLRFEVSAGLGSDQYWIGGPTTDFDHDGRLDMFAVEWEPSLPSILFRNASPGGHWLEVSLGVPGDGIGATVRLTDESGNPLGEQEIGVGGGYSSGKLPVAHFGLGEMASVDVEITLPDGTVTELTAVAADRHIRWPDGC